MTSKAIETAHKALVECVEALHTELVAKWEERLDDDDQERRARLGSEMHEIQRIKGDLIELRQKLSELAEDQGNE